MPAIRQSLVGQKMKNLKIMNRRFADSTVTTGMLPFIRTQDISAGEHINIGGTMSYTVIVWRCDSLPEVRHDLTRGTSSWRNFRTACVRRVRRWLIADQRR